MYGGEEEVASRERSWGQFSTHMFNAIHTLIRWFCMMCRFVLWCFIHGRQPEHTVYRRSRSEPIHIWFMKCYEYWYWMILIPFTVMQKYSSSQLQTRRVPRLVLHLLNFQAGFAHNLSQLFTIYFHQMREFSSNDLALTWSRPCSCKVFTRRPQSQLLQKRSLLLALRLVTAGISLWATGIYRPWLEDSGKMNTIEAFLFDSPTLA